MPALDEKVSKFREDTNYNIFLHMTTILESSVWQVGMYYGIPSKNQPIQKIT